jgi:SAM-dependent methyltransferase
MSGVTRRATCRLCGSKALDLVMPILPSAIGDAFVTRDKLGAVQPVYPLDVYLCRDCGHLQNLDVVDPAVLFGDYTYRTSVSPALVRHFRDYAAAVATDLKLPKGALVVEIGSNDGSLLRAFQERGLRVRGVDAAADIAARATAEGIPTLNAFFSSGIAAAILAEQGPAALLCANNVYAHIDDMTDATKGIRALLAPDGAFVFEVSYVPDMIERMVFDTIYHEHVSHHALVPLERFFNRLDLTLFDAVRVDSKGGSIRVFAQPRSTGQRPQSARLRALLAEETRRGIDRPEIYRTFFAAIEQRKRATLDLLGHAAAEGKRIAAYGASTTTTTLVYHFELGRFLGFIVDDNPIKHGLYSPGLHIPVFPSAALLERKPDIVIILAWLYADLIIARNHAYLEAGGKFLVPLPDVRLVG